MVKHSNFYKVLANNIPNTILTETEFAQFFSEELDKYVFNNIPYELNFTDSVKQIIKS